MKITDKIKREFELKAIPFIETIFRLEKKKVPVLVGMSHDDFLIIYQEAYTGLTLKLMQSRQFPIDPHYLRELKEMNANGILPKSIKIILESLDS